MFIDLAKSFTTNKIITYSNYFTYKDSISKDQSYYYYTDILDDLTFLGTLNYYTDIKPEHKDTILYFIETTPKEDIKSITPDKLKEILLNPLTILSPTDDSNTLNLDLNILDTDYFEDYNTCNNKEDLLGYKDSRRDSREYWTEREGIDTRMLDISEIEEKDRLNSRTTSQEYKEENRAINALDLAIA